MILRKTYHYIRQQLGVEASPPFDPGWAASSDFLKLIKQHCHRHRPRNILECGSGFSTQVMAQCCQRNKKGCVTSLEHDEQYYSITSNHLAHKKLQAYTEVIHAPLTDIEADGATYAWYDITHLPSVTFDMLVVDGPPAWGQQYARFPALPVLYDRLADGCRVFLDDAVRDDEKEIVKRWLALYPNTEHEYLELDRGCSILTIDKSD